MTRRKLRSSQGFPRQPPPLWMGRTTRKTGRPPPCKCAGGDHRIAPRAPTARQARRGLLQAPARAALPATPPDLQAPALQVPAARVPAARPAPTRRAALAPENPQPRIPPATRRLPARREPWACSTRCATERPSTSGGARAATTAKAGCPSKPCWASRSSCCWPPRHWSTSSRGRERKSEDHSGRVDKMLPREEVAERAVPAMAPGRPAASMPKMR